MIKKSVLIVSFTLVLILGLTISVMAIVGHSFDQITPGTFTGARTINIDDYGRIEMTNGNNDIAGENSMFSAQFSPNTGFIYGKIAGKSSWTNNIFNFIQYGIMGKTTTTEDNTAAIVGIRDQNSGGALGYRDSSSNTYGVYGKHINGHYGFIGGKNYAIMGVNNNGNFGKLGTATYGIQGYSSTGWAGYFEGKLIAKSYWSSDGSRGITTCTNKMQFKDGLYVGPC